MSKKIDLTHIELKELLSIYGSPLYIYDGDKIRAHAKYFMETFKTYIPNFKQYFAVKALPNPDIMQILYEEGMGFDCSSPVEINMCKKITKITNDILYSGNYTSVEELQHALDNKVIINLDDYDGFNNLIEACKLNNESLPEIICFRLNPGIGKTDSGTKSNILGGSDSKFGMSINRIIESYKLAFTRGIKRFGIHVMTGSCVLNIEYWKELIDILFENINKIKNELDITFEFIDLGGGIGINYRPDEKEIDLVKLAKTINEQLILNAKKYDLTIPCIYMENGRYITGHFGWFVSTCKSIKETPEINFYGLDTTICNILRIGIYENSYHHITIPRLEEKFEELLKLKEEDFEKILKLKEANVVGTLCENNDWFAKKRMLPIGIIKGDIFVIHDAGAHCKSMQSNYNGKLKCGEILITKKNIKLIKNKQTEHDYLK
jgi:diaminopimelate decarboxylase